MGGLTDTVHPRLITGFGFTAIIGSLTWMTRVMTPDSATWEILLPMAVFGVGNAAVWAPNSATATRQVGAVPGAPPALLFERPRYDGFTPAAASLRPSVRR